jgi:peptide-methionine (R)-S-oxide reductase
MNRRAFLSFLGIFALAISTPMRLAHAAVEKLKKSNEEWKKLLSSQQYDILREEGTEAPHTSPLLNEHRIGTFHCVACGLALFDSKTKYDSGTGWPSFYDHLPDALETKTDHLIGFARTEYHCTRCGGHHGHIFDDGPKPTGLRYCNNGAVLKFMAKG